MTKVTFNRVFVGGIALAMLVVAVQIGLSWRSKSVPPVHFAAWAGDIEELERLLAKDPELLDMRHFRERTPLHRAVKTCKTAAAELLVSKGADVNARDGDGVTPLHFAAECDPKLVQILLTQGADVNAKDLRERTPLNRAVFSGDMMVVSLLLAAGADPDSRDETGATPLHRAC